MKKAIQQIVYGLVLGSLLIAPLWSGNVAIAAPTQDNELGIWTDEYTDSSGVTSPTSITVAGGKVTLQDTGGAVYASSGTFITSLITPALIGKWNEISWVGTTPEGTSIKVQFLDNNQALFDTNVSLGVNFLPGNNTGFTTSPVDISSVPIDGKMSNNTGKISRVYIKVTLATTDTSVTPELDSLSLSWLLAQGDTSAAAAASTAWPTGTGQQQIPLRSTYTEDVFYPAVAWTKSLDGFAGQWARGTGNVVYQKNNGGTTSSTGNVLARLMALNKNTGATIAERRLPGNAFTSNSLSVSENGSVYIEDQYNDWLFAYNGSDMSPKFVADLAGGHGVDQTVIGSDGSLYVFRANIFGDFQDRVIAFNPDGTNKFTGPWIDAPSGKNQVGSFMSIAPNGNIIVGTSVYSGGPTYTNEGKLYAISPTDGSVVWSYNTGDISQSQPAIADNGTIYVASAYPSSNVKKIYAINSDGTLLWETSIGTTTDYYNGITIKADGNLSLMRLNGSGQAKALEYRSSTDGSLISSTNTPFTYFFNGFLGTGAGGAIVAGNTAGFSGPEVRYYDNAQANRWTFTPSSIGLMSYFMQDESGTIYGNRTTAFTPTVTQAFALKPWTIDVSMSQPTAGRNDRVTINARTSMLATNLFNDGANKMQAIIGETKIPLTYTSTDSDGTTLWTGQYTIPSDQENGSITITVEGSANGIVTDIPTHFDTPATGSSNTGLITSITYPVATSTGGSGGSGGSAPAPVEETGPGVIVPPHDDTDDTTTPNPNPKKASDKKSESTKKVVQEPKVARKSATCYVVPRYLTTAIGFDKINDQQDVRLLQQYLNLYEGAGLAVDGVYSETVRAAVMKWQKAHKIDLLPQQGEGNPDTIIPSGDIGKDSLRLIKMTSVGFCAVKK